MSQWHYQDGLDGKHEPWLATEEERRDWEAGDRIRRAHEHRTKSHSSDNGDGITYTLEERKEEQRKAENFLNGCGIGCLSIVVFILLAIMKGCSCLLTNQW